MNALIIEDERSAVNRLRRLLQQVDPSIRVLADMGTVVETVEWFAHGGVPDVAFMDVHLADGESFEIFKRVEVPCPVIFTTAYDAHALNAFRVNAVDYLLKPLVPDDLKAALERLAKWGAVRDASGLSARGADAPVAPIRRFLIRYGEHIRVVEPDGIAYFHSLEKNTFLRTREGKDLPMDESLDRLEKQLDHSKFFRLNRQVIAHIDSIKDLLAYSKSRVKVQLQPPYDADAVVSSERTPLFKKWLSGR